METLKTSTLILLEQTHIIELNPEPLVTQLKHPNICPSQKRLNLPEPALLLILPVSLSSLAPPPKEKLNPVLSVAVSPVAPSPPPNMLKIFPPLLPLLPGSFTADGEAKMLPARLDGGTGSTELVPKLNAIGLKDLLYCAEKKEKAKL